MESIKREELVGQEKLDAFDNEEEGFMWLILAAKQGHLKRVQKFVAHGVNINAVDKNGSTALIEAASEGYHEIVNYLINNGANVDQTDKHELAALMCACMSGHMDVACVLVQADANLNLTDMSGMTALDLALENNHLELLKAIAALGVNIGSVKEIRPPDTVTKKKDELSWLGKLLTERSVSKNLVSLCEEKIVFQEGFGSPLTLTRTSDKHFHRAYLTSLGFNALGVCETLLTLHGDLQVEYKSQLSLQSGVAKFPEAAARAAVKIVLADCCGNDVTWGEVVETIPA